MPALLLLPGLSLHTPFYGATREPYTQLTVQAERIEGSIGRDIPLIGQRSLPAPAWGSREVGSLDWQVNLAAGTFMGFSPIGELTFDLLTFDGIFGLPVDLRWNQLELRVGWFHLSAHFADGIRRLPDKPDSSSQAGYSREWMDIYAAYWLGPVRPYLGARLSLHSADGQAGPGVQLGLTTSHRHSWGPYLGADLSMRREFGWQPTLSGQTGIELNGQNHTSLRLGLAGYYGMRDEGKHAGESESYLGLTLGFSPAPTPQP